MKKIFVCAILATVLAFAVGGCSKQEESKETTSEKTGSMMQETTNKAGEMASEAKTAAEDMAQQAGQAAEEAKETGSQMVEETKEAVSEQADAMKEKVEGMTAPAAPEAQKAEEQAADMTKNLPGTAK